MKDILIYVAIIYFVIINLLGLIIMAVDKKRAIKKAWRIPEATLFLIALIGGSIGTTCGMYLFHHKTKHWYFVVGMPLILLAQCIAAGLIFV